MICRIASGDGRHTWALDVSDESTLTFGDQPEDVGVVLRAKLLFEPLDEAFGVGHAERLSVYSA